MRAEIPRGSKKALRQRRMRLEVQSMLKNAVHVSMSPAVRRVLTSVLVLLAAFASAGSLLAQGFDPLKKPVLPVPVPANWTGALTPTKILGDSSWWNFGGTPTNLNP